MIRSWVGPARLLGCLGIGLAAWSLLPWAGWRLAAAVRPLLYLATFTLDGHQYLLVAEAMAWVVVGVCLVGAVLTFGAMRAWWQAVPGLHDPAVVTPVSPETIRLPATVVGVAVFAAVVGWPAALLVETLDAEALVGVDQLFGAPLVDLVRTVALGLHLAGCGAAALAAYAWVRSGGLLVAGLRARRQPSWHEQRTS